MASFIKKSTRIVCLGGGIGTVNLILGLKEYTEKITVAVSMGDDGGSAGRLRRIYEIPPPGDLINCIHALSNVDPLMRDLLTFRFLGKRYGSDWTLGGHKLGNLMLTALTSMTGDFEKAITYMQTLFQTRGEVLPATLGSIKLKAVTMEGRIIEGEQNIDLGKYNGGSPLSKVSIIPGNAKATKKVLDALKVTDVIIAGPGDLYTTILPVLLVKEILSEIKKSKAIKIFVVNVANKPYETPNYKVSDYAQAVVKHCKGIVFDHFLVNNNTSPIIPKKFKYEYVTIAKEKSKKLNGIMKQKDLVDEDFPIYHNSKKLARAVSTLL